MLVVLAVALRGIFSTNLMALNLDFTAATFIVVCLYTTSSSRAELDHFITGMHDVHLENYAFHLTLQYTWEAFKSCSAFLYIDVSIGCN